MELKLKRIARKSAYTIGKLYIDGKYVCDTLEDTDRGLSSDMPLSEIKRIKVPSVTAIPTGTYTIVMNVQSPKFSKYKSYAFCNGYLPRLLKVPGYEGVLMHIGNYPTDTEGCILVGENKKKGMVLNSTVIFKAIYTILKAAADKGEQITITVE